jgi:hypothetical protein
MGLLSVCMSNVSGTDVVQNGNAATIIALVGIDAHFGGRLRLQGFRWMQSGRNSRRSNIMSSKSEGETIIEVVKWRELTRTQKRFKAVFCKAQ